MSDAAYDADAVTTLPSDVGCLILQQLTAPEAATLSLVSKSWQRELSRNRLWSFFLKRDFPNADHETLQLAAVKAQARGAAPENKALAIYKILAKLHVCSRCQLEFRDGDNSPHNCRFHPGVLFSGGVLNGSGLHWTCCNRRAHHVAMLQRHADGCTDTRHASDDSLWMPHFHGVKPRPADGKAPASRTGASCSAACGQRRNVLASVEWHPDRLPGLEALPSRILLDNQFMRLGF